MILLSILYYFKEKLTKATKRESICMAFAHWTSPELRFNHHTVDFIGNI